MNSELSRSRVRVLASLGIVVYGISVAPAVEAYVGPGAGLGVLGILLAVVVTVLMGLVGLVLWPIRALANRRKLKVQAAANEAGARQETDDSRRKQSATYENLSTNRDSPPAS